MSGSDGRLRLRDAELEVAWLGDRGDDEPTVVFLHEGLGSVAMWGDAPRAVCDRLGWSGLVYSRAGYGRSTPTALPWPTSFLHREAHDVLPALLDAAGIDRALLFGHSDGATIALIAAGSGAPRAGTPNSRIIGVVAEAPHVMIEPCTLAGIREANVAFEEGKLERVLARYHDDAASAFRGWNDVWLSDAFAQWDIAEHVSAIEVPILVVQGLDDQYGTVAQVEAIEAGSSGPVDRLVLEACGHSPHRDQLDAVLDAVGRFVDQHELGFSGMRASQDLRSGSLPRHGASRTDRSS